MKTAEKFEAEYDRTYRRGYFLVVSALLTVVAVQSVKGCAEGFASGVREGMAEKAAWRQERAERTEARK